MLLPQGRQHLYISKKLSLRGGCGGDGGGLTLDFRDFLIHFHGSQEKEYTQPPVFPLF